MSSALESALRLSVRWHFGHMTYPELNVVLREVDDLLMERVAHPEKAYSDQRAFDQACERELAWMPARPR
jgi:hypothetical protein